jgi:hypothetical protein
LDSLHTYNSQLQLFIARSLMHTLYSSLQHVLSLFSLPCLHRLSPGNGSELCPLLPCSTAPVLTGWRLSYNQLYSFPSKAIPHALTAHRLHSLTAYSRLSTRRPTHSLRSPNSLTLNSRLTTLHSLHSRCLSAAPSGGRFSASGLTSSQARDHRTPPSDLWL